MEKTISEKSEDAEEFYNSDLEEDLEVPCLIPLKKSQSIY
jgi:hypothetical protein